ncbi:prepilin-type N-terminal cleavage/methylation domain-containing protein [Pantanalinema rosaneae CENA516]|uniref:prepilin-type N-terminal cleavage/methylation domain-containing protein n=1 Tax=Pantanalinema rosaneae TaxID=1620701 RepID=UPI003D6DF9B7
MNKRMWRKMQRRQSTAGFTLLEMLVLMIIIGVLFAIAAPGWDAIISRQRVSTAREQVVQVIRQAQSEARTSKTPRLVVFDPNPNGVPRVAHVPFPTTDPRPSLPLNLNNVGNWRILGNGDIKRGAIQMTSTSPSQIVIESDGSIAQPPTVNASQPANFTITISRANAPGDGTKRCAIVATLLGAIRQAEGSSCNI